MKRSYGLFKIHVCIAFFLTVNCNAQQSKLENAKKAIANSNRLYFQAFAKADSSIFIERYARDCCIMPPSTPALCGTEAPLNFYKAAYNMGIRNGSFTTTDVFGDGEEFVTETGVFQLFDIDKLLLDKGKYLVLWKKTADGWKMFRDSFSSDLHK